MAKLNALKEIRDRPKKVNNKFKYIQISIATKDKPSLSYQLFMSFAPSKRYHNTKMTQPQGTLILQGK